MTVLPYAMSATTDGRGEFAITGLQVTERFRLITIRVSAPGYASWTRIDDRLYKDQWAFADVRLGSAEVVSTGMPPLVEQGLESRRVGSTDARFGLMRPYMTPGVPVYTDEWLTPPSIRVQHLVKGQRCAPTYPLQQAPAGTVKYPFQYYINKVLPMEISPTWPAEAIKANSMVIKNYAWYWINRGGKVYGGGFTEGDVDDTTQYQCFDPNALTYQAFLDATAATIGLGIHVGTAPNETITESSYLGFIQGNPDTYEKCGNSDGTVLYQLGSKAWADAVLEGCGEPKDFRWILTHYYSGITIFNVPAPATAAITWKRPNETPIVIHFESKGAWRYQVLKWTPPYWSQLALLDIDGSGNLQEWWTDNAVTQGQGETYSVYAASSSGQWSPYTYIGTETGWTTDLWNPSFENALRGNQAWFWSGFNNPTTSIATGWGSASALRFSSPQGTWSSVYQDVPYQATICPNLVARQQTGQSVVLSLFVYVLPSEQSFSMTWSVPGDGQWYRIPLNPDGCRTFAGGSDTSLRFIVRLDNGGTIDVDRARLVFDSTTYWRY